MAAISGRMPAISVQYTNSKGERATKDFANPVEARKAYGKWLKAGKEPSVKGKGAKAITAPAKRKASKPAPATDTAKDPMGCRLGSQSAAINAALGTTPATVQALAAATKLNAARIRNHLKFLVNRGLATRTAKGFALKAKANQ